MGVYGCRGRVDGPCEGCCDLSELERAVAVECCCTRLGASGPRDADQSISKEAESIAVAIANGSMGPGADCAVRCPDEAVGLISLEVDAVVDIG